MENEKKNREDKSDLLDEFFDIDIKIRIEKILSLYHPRLLANLSREGYEVYNARKSTAEEILEILEKNKPTIKKSEFISIIEEKKKITQKKINAVTDDLEKICLETVLEFLGELIK